MASTFFGALLASPPPGKRRRLPGVDSDSTPAEFGAYFASRTRKNEGGCLIWLRAFTCGVPKATIGRKAVNARRLAYELAGRKLPEGEIVVAVCAEPRCVAPKHLRAVTRKENWAKRAKLGLVASGKVLSARTTRSARSRSKLTIETVRAIRARYAEGVVQRRIAEEFGISFSQVNKIVLRRAWREPSWCDV